jgi:vitamin B12 transporter
VVETYPSTFSGNPALQPEKSRSFEIGIEQPFLDGRARAGVTLFQNRIRNLIQANSGFDSLENVGRVKTEGVESTLTLNLHPRISIRANHTYTMAENQSGDEDLLRRPAHMATLVVEGRPTDASTLTWSTVYTGHRKDGDAITFERVSRPGYALTNVAATLQIDEHWKLFGRIDNLFDRKYDDPEGFSSSGLAGYFGVSSEY